MLNLFLKAVYNEIKKQNELFLWFRLLMFFSLFIIIYSWFFYLFIILSMHFCVWGITCTTSMILNILSVLVIFRLGK